MSGASLSRQSSLLCDEDALSRVTLALPTLLDGTFHLEARNARRFQRDLKEVFADRNANLFGVIEDALKAYCQEHATDKTLTKGTFLRNVKVLAERCEFNAAGLAETASEIYDESRGQLVSPGKRKRDDERAGSYDSTMALFSLEAAAADMSYGFPTGIF